MLPTQVVIAGTVMRVPGMDKIARLGVRRLIGPEHLPSHLAEMRSLPGDISHEELLRQSGGQEYARNIAFTFIEALAYIAHIRHTRYQLIDRDGYFLYLISEIDDQLYVGQLAHWADSQETQSADEWSLAAHPMDCYPPKKGKVFMSKVIDHEAPKPEPIIFSKSFARHEYERDPALSVRV